MQIASFLAKRIAFNNQRSFSRFIIRLATAATALSVAAMIITLAFVNGFQYAVSNKIFNFWGHLRVQEYEPDKAMIAEETPWAPNDTTLQILHLFPQVKQVTIDGAFGGWKKAQAEHFADGGFFDQIYQPGR